MRMTFISRRTVHWMLAALLPVPVIHNQALGGAIGGVVASRIGNCDSQKVATIAGALIGVLAGQATGRSMDQADGSWQLVGR